MLLLLGKTGLLGSEFATRLKERGISFVAPGSDELNVLDFEEVLSYLRANSITKILHCVAYTDTEKAEQEEVDKCEALNVRALENLLLAKIPVIHFSSDYVFGHQDPDVEILEEMPRAPLNRYGVSKYKAEQLLEASGVDFWNIRTTWLFGATKKNFVSAILGASLNRDKLKIVHDQVGRPTYAKDLASYVVSHFVVGTVSSGHYHCQNSGPKVSWAEFAEFFLGEVGWEGEVERIKALDWPSKVERPRNSVLHNSKLEVEMRDWRDGVREWLELRIVG